MSGMWHGSCGGGHQVCMPISAAQPELCELREDVLLAVAVNSVTCHVVLYVGSPSVLAARQQS